MAEILKKYIIETRRFKGKFNRWVSDSDHIKVATRYIRFYPTEGEDMGKKMYITFDNIHIVREV